MLLVTPHREHLTMRFSVLEKSEKEIGFITKRFVEGKAASFPPFCSSYNYFFLKTRVSDALQFDISTPVCHRERAQLSVCFRVKSFFFYSSENPSSLRAVLCP